MNELEFTAEVAGWIKQRIQKNPSLKNRSILETKVVAQIRAAKCPYFERSFFRRFSSFAPTLSLRALTSRTQHLLVMCNRRSLACCPLCAFGSPLGYYSDPSAPSRTSFATISPLYSRAEPMRLPAPSEMGAKKSMPLSQEVTQN